MIWGRARVIMLCTVPFVALFAGSNCVHVIIAVHVTLGPFGGGASGSFSRRAPAK
jgi:formylmethanofuran:tetrahydromethanopterin formyltransferase